MGGHRLEEVFVLWSAARAEANLAYDGWCDCPGPTPTPSIAPQKIVRMRPKPTSQTSLWTLSSSRNGR